MHVWNWFRHDLIMAFSVRIPIQRHPLLIPFVELGEIWLIFRVTAWCSAIRLNPAVSCAYARKPPAWTQPPESLTWPGIFFNTVFFTIHLFGSLPSRIHHCLKTKEVYLCKRSTSYGLWGSLPNCEIKFEDARTVVRLHDSDHTWVGSDSRKIEVH